ncbi:Transcription factor bHLH149 [Linum grandiflorum]
MASMIGSDPELGSTADASSSGELQQRTKRRKIGHDYDCATTSGGEEKSVVRRWKTEAEHRIYSSKLLEALRSSRRSSTTAAPATRVRDAADRVLAAAARGSTRWSRAILAKRRRLTRVRKVRRARVVGEAIRRNPRFVVSTEEEEEETNNSPPAVDKKIRTLSRLVPGCRKAPLTNLLEEVGDYIAALEMQVKAMAALAEILSPGGGGGGVPITIQNPAAADPGN